MTLYSPLIFLGSVLLTLTSGLTAMAAEPSSSTTETESAIVATQTTTATDEAFEDGGIFALYEQNRKQGTPSLVTPDLLMLGYSQLRKLRIAELEQDQLAPALAEVLHTLKKDLEKKGDKRTEAASANLELVSLLISLLENKVPDSTEAVAAEYALIMAGAGVETSPLWRCAMDYSQFLPRGRYTESESAAAYFRAVRYASTALFAFKPSKATGVSAKQAALNADRARAFADQLGREPVAEQYEQLIGAMEWHFGPSDDLHLEDVKDNLEVAESQSPEELARRLVKHAIDNDRVPKILGGVVDRSKLEPDITAAQSMIGWRFLPAGYSSSAAAFQQLVYETGDSLSLDCERCESGPANSSVIMGKVVKGYPSYLEILSLLGSTEAQEQLNKRHLLAYTDYEKRANHALNILGTAAGLERNQQYVVQAALRDLQPEQALNTAAGFWVWQKYLNLLYQKQSYTVIGKGIKLGKKSRDGGSLVSATSVYMALSNLVATHAAHDSDPRWNRLKSVIDRCVEISSRADLGLEPTPQQGKFLNEVDMHLRSVGAGDDKPVVVDIHTNAADSQVLEVGTVYPVIHRQGVARGAGFMVREIKMPVAERLTDEAWQALLEKNEL